MSRIIIIDPDFEHDRGHNLTANSIIAAKVVEGVVSMKGDGQSSHKPRKANGTEINAVLELVLEAQSVHCSGGRRALWAAQ